MSVYVAHLTKPALVNRQIVSRDKGDLDIGIGVQIRHGQGALLRESVLECLRPTGSRGRFGSWSVRWRYCAPVRLPTSTKSR